MSSSGMYDSEHEVEDSQSSNHSREEENHRSDEEPEATPEKALSEDDEISGSPHRRKRQKKIGADLISSLHDSLLHHILSFLDIDQAVRTSILSKRWQCLWTSMPDLTFSQNDSGRDINQFVALVYRTLLPCNPGKLNKLAVEFWYVDAVAPDIDAWIRFATQRKVANLELRLITEEISDHNYPLPQHLYRNTSLRNLRLSSVKVLPSGIVGWTSLKSLTLELLQLAEEGMSKILAGSPALEFLKMDELEFIGHLNIYSASLKGLVIWTQHPPNNFELEISAPNLQSLHVVCSLGQFRLLDVSSLVSAYIDFTPASSLREISEYVNQLLLSISRVEELELGSRCIKVFSKLESNLYFPSILKVLKLDLYKEEDIMPCLSGLLRSTRNLETLFVEMDDCCGRECLIGEGKHWESLARSLRRSWIPLKTVKISGNCYDHGNCILELVKFLLKNAMVLEKMVISTHHFIKVSRELLNFPRSSPDVVIVFT